MSWCDEIEPQGAAGAGNCRMTSADFLRMLERLRGGQSPADSLVLNVHLGLNDEEFDNFFVNAGAIELDGEVTILRLESVDFDASQSLYVPCAGIRGIVSNVELGIHELVLDPVLLLPLRRLYDKVIERQRREN